MAVWPVKVPELAHLLLEVVGAQHPILILDHVPDLERETRKTDGRSIPVPARFLLPSRPDLVVALCDRYLALGDAARQPRICGDALPADAGKLGNAERGIAEGPDRARLHPAIVHRPLADIDLAKADLDEVACRRGDWLARALGVIELGELLLPIVHVEAKHEIGMAQRLLVHAQTERMLVGKIERIVDVPHSGARGLGERD